MTEFGTLRRMGGRTEHGRGYDYWFPLVLLGFGLLVLLARTGVRDDFGWFAYAPATPADEVHAIAVLEPGAQYYNTPLPFGAAFTTRDWTWTLLVAVTLAGAVLWYGVRARAGWRHVAVAVGGVLAVLACHAVAGIADAMPDEGGLVRSVALPLAGLGVLAGAYFWFGPRRRPAVVVAVVCLTAGVSALAGAWAYGLLDPLLITCGLLALAWYERSRLVAVLAVVLPVAFLLFPYGVLSTLVPAVLVLAVAVTALVLRGGLRHPART